MDFLIMTEDEKQEYSNSESNEDDTSSDYTPSHHEYSDDEDEECFCSSCSELKEDLSEDDIDVRLFPCNNFYQKLGIDYIMARNDLLPDENMFPLYEKMSEDMMCPSEDWERQKQQKSVAYTEIKNSNHTIIEYL
tara:strand:+ start:1624 stop:2028 length:405 start_codon:yes stop_codon:yes gene_type:complete